MTGRNFIFCIFVFFRDNPPGIEASHSRRRGVGEKGGWVGGGALPEYDQQFHQYRHHLQLSCHCAPSSGLNANYIVIFVMWIQFQLHCGMRAI